MESVQSDQLHVPANVDRVRTSLIVSSLGRRPSMPNFRQAEIGHNLGHLNQYRCNELNIVKTVVCYVATHPARRTLLTLLKLLISNSKIKLKAHNCVLRADEYGEMVRTRES